MKRFLLLVSMLFVSGLAMATDQYVKVDNETARVTRTVVATVKISDVKKELATLKKKLKDDDTRCGFIAAATEHKIDILTNQISSLESVGVQSK